MFKDQSVLYREGFFYYIDLLRKDRHILFNLTFDEKVFENYIKDNTNE